MILRLIALASAGVTALVCAVSSEVILERMVGEVNPHLPENARYSLDWWHAPKYLRLLREYRRIFPSGPRVGQLRLLSFILFVSAGCGALTLGLGYAGAGWIGTGGCVVAWLMHRNWNTR